MPKHNKKQKKEPPKKPQGERRTLIQSMAIALIKAKRSKKK